MTKRVLVLIFVFVTSSISAAEIRLRASVVCSTPVVRLAEVAEIRGDDPVRSEELGHIALCPAPAANQSLAQHQIRELLILSGVEASEIIVTGSQTVELLPDAATAARRTGTAFSSIHQTSYSASQAFANASAPSDSKATPRTLAPPANAATQKLVQKGAIVSVCVRRPGICVTAPGKALEAGSGGDTINVEFADSRERILARVVGPQTVEVATTNPIANNK